MKTPKVSVLTPMYNTHESDLRAMIESVLGQTFTDFEFLLLNDSPDNQRLREIVSSYNDPRIKYLENPQNLGITKSRNRLIELARGQYLAVLDHDDVSMPNRFQLEVDFLDAHPHIGAVGGNLTESRDGKHWTRTYYPENDNDIKISLVNQPYVCVPNHPTCMIRKSVLIDNNVRYDENWSPCEDRKLFLDLMDYTCFHNLPDIVLKYNWHGDNTTIRHWQKMYDQLPIIVAMARARYPMYYDEWKHNKIMRALAGDTSDMAPSRVIKIKLFGFIPVIKVHRRGGRATVYLFNFIPLYKQRG